MKKKHGYNPLPGIDNLKQELDVYYKYYSKDDESKMGVVAIRIKNINN